MCAPSYPFVRTKLTIASQCYFDSQEGIGSNFHVELVAPQAIRPASSPSVAAPFDLSHKTCLILERHDITRKVIARACSSFGLAVSSPSNDELDAFFTRKSVYDLVLVDTVLLGAASFMEKLRKSGTSKIVALVKSMTVMTEELRALTDASLVKRTFSFCIPVNNLSDLQPTNSCQKIKARKHDIQSARR